jgi:hypothetical protein
MPIERNQLLEITKKVLINLGITDIKTLEINYTYKVGNKWRVGFLFEKQYDWIGGKRSGIYEINADNGEILFSALDRFWK